MHARSMLAFAVAVVLAQLLAVRPAAAQSALTPEQAAARRGLLSDAAAARARGDHEHAVDFAERAGRIEMTPSVRVFIAQEREALGQLIAAYGSADLCVREANEAANVHQRDAIVAECRSLLNDISARLGRVIVRVPGSPPAGFEVTVAGSRLADAYYGAPYRVTPGRVAVEARAADGSMFRVEVSVAPGQEVEVDVTLTRRVIATAAETAPQPPPSTPSSSVHPIPLVVAGLGVVGLVLGGAFYAVRTDARNGLIANDCTAVASGYACDDTSDAQSRYSRAVTFDTASSVSLVAGAVLLVGGAAWWLLGRHAGHADQPTVAFGPSDRGASITIGARF